MEIWFGRDKLCAHDILAGPMPSHHGAQATFLGVVRDQQQGRKVLSLEYDLFEPLCRRVFEQIVNEAKEKYGRELQVQLYHRYGHLEIGEISVGIGVSAAHRAEAFGACRYMIEEIKKRAPIWKKEYYEDGQSDWVQGHSLCEGA